MPTDVKGLWLGNSTIRILGSVSPSNHSLDASTDGAGMVFQAQSADPITHIGIRYGARTGTPPTYVATLEGVSTSTGHPDGTDVGGGSPTAVTFTPPADTTWNGLFKWFQLTNPYTPTRGQWLASTIRYSSGTIDASNFSTFTTNVQNLSSTYNMPYAERLTAGSWAKQSLGAVAQAIRTATTRFGVPYESAPNTTTNTSGNRIAMRFSIPAAMGSAFTVRGLQGLMQVSNNNAATQKIGLWNAAGTMLQEVSVDTDQIVVGSGWHRFYFDETTLSSLSPDTAYYLGIERGSDVGDKTAAIQGIGLNGADDRLCFAGGTDFCLATWNGSAWTDLTTIVAPLDLILGEVTEASGGSGGGPLIGGRLVRP